MNSDRAEIVAGHAGKTTVHLFNEVGAKFELAFKTLARKRHASPRRGGFFEVFAIGWAGGEAKSASNAIQILGFPRLNQIQALWPHTILGLRKMRTLLMLLHFPALLIYGP